MLTKARVCVQQLLERRAGILSSLCRLPILFALSAPICLLNVLQNALWRFLILQVGGKGISDGMEERVSVFVRGLLEKAEALGYSTHVAFFDQNYKADDK